MGSLTFDPIGHRYYNNGTRIPGVTEVLKDQGLLVISEYSTGPDTGIKVHKDIHAIETGGAAEYPEVSGYLDAYRSFKHATNFVVKQSELRVFSPAYEYAGTIDLLGLLQGERTLLDIKTGVESPATAIQIAAYWQALPPGAQTGVKCSTLYLKSGKYNLVPLSSFELLQSVQMFNAALKVWQFRQQNSLLGE